jgi:hypothetical protein
MVALKPPAPYPNAAFLGEVEGGARADDPIGQWLKQEKADGQNNEVRPDLNALTDQQLRDIFKVWPEQADSPKLIEQGSAHARSLYLARSRCCRIWRSYRRSQN